MDENKRIVICRRCKKPEYWGEMRWLSGFCVCRDCYREELKTIEGWHKSGCNSWDEYCKPGDMVDQGVADYFLGILPPRTMTRNYFQVGEPYSHAINPKTMKSCGTYATFAVRGKEIWEYCGNCFPHML